MLKSQSLKTSGLYCRLAAGEDVDVIVLLSLEILIVPLFHCLFLCGVGGKTQKVSDFVTMDAKSNIQGGITNADTKVSVCVCVPVRAVCL